MARRTTFLTVLLGTLTVAVPAHAADRIVLQREAGLSAADRADVRADAGVTLDHVLRIAGVEVVRAAPGGRAEALAALRAHPDVAWAEPDRRVTAAREPLQNQLWGLENLAQNVGGRRGTNDADIDAPEAWTVTRGAGVTVAVVDSGADPGHPDLSARLLPGLDWVDGDTDPDDLEGHGTHVAGTVAAADDGTGVVGVAPQAAVLPLRVLDADGNGWSSDVAAAFDYAGDQGVRVVNASLGADQPTMAEQLAIQDHPNTLYVVAAGNDEADLETTPHYPCSYPEANMLCVGASDQDDELAGFSNYGATSVDLFAPGVDIVSDFPRGRSTVLDGWYETGDGSEIMNGTSMAAPHVSGAAALVAAEHPGYTAADIKSALMNSADPAGGLAGRGVVAGRLNAARALGLNPPAPTDTIPPGQPSGAVAVAGVNSVTLDWDDTIDPGLAGYRIYRRTAAAVWSVIPTAEPSASGTVISGLPSARTVIFGVAAVDTAGNESVVRSFNAVIPFGPPVIAPPPVDAGPPTLVPVPAAVGSLKLTGRIVVCAGKRCHPRSGRLSFSTSAATTLNVTLQRRGARATATTVSVPAGTTRWKVSRTLAGLRVKPGRYQLTLTAPAGPASLGFQVRAR